MVTAELKNYRQSPRKVRLVADAIRGKKVNWALEKLSFTVKRASNPVKKLLESAIANAKNNHGLQIDNLFIKNITVNEGYTIKRSRARARGAAFPIRKRTSRIKIILDEKGAKSTSVKEVEKKTTKTKKETK